MVQTSQSLKAPKVEANVEITVIKTYDSGLDSSGGSHVSPTKDLKLLHTEHDSQL